MALAYRPSFSVLFSISLPHMSPLAFTPNCSPLSFHIRHVLLLSVLSFQTPFSSLMENFLVSCHPHTPTPTEIHTITEAKLHIRMKSTQIVSLARAQGKQTWLSSKTVKGQIWSMPCGPSFSGSWMGQKLLTHGSGMSPYDMDALDSPDLPYLPFSSLTSFTNVTHSWHLSP